MPNTGARKGSDGCREGPPHAPRPARRKGAPTRCDGPSWPARPPRWPPAPAGPARRTSEQTTVDSIYLPKFFLLSTFQCLKFMQPISSVRFLSIPSQTLNPCYTMLLLLPSHAQPPLSSCGCPPPRASCAAVAPSAPGRRPVP